MTVTRYFPSEADACYAAATLKMFGVRARIDGPTRVLHYNGGESEEFSVSADVPVALWLEAELEQEHDHGRSTQWDEREEQKMDYRDARD